MSTTSTKNVNSISNPPTTPNTNTKWKSVTMKSILLEGVSGGLSGLCAYSLTLPLEVIQTRLQSTVDKERIKHLTPITLPWKNKLFNNYQLHFKNKYFIVGRDIMLKDGWKGFFKGYVPLIIGIIPSRSIYFGTNTHTRMLFEDTYGADRHETVKIAFSAVMGSVTASVITCPVWVTKTHLQLKRKLLKHHVTMRDVLKEIYQKHGMGGFYRGLTCSFYGSIETMFYWLMYEQFKKQIQDSNGNHNRELSAWDSTKASLFAKTFSIFLGYPHEVARTRMRHGTVDANGIRIYREFWSTLYKISTQEGFTYLYSGLLFQLLRQVPNATIAMVMFEQIRNALQKI